MKVYRVTYQGIFSPIERDFTTMDRAAQWAWQIGKLHDATIEEVTIDLGISEIVREAE
jgi:hypothetical protein